jgi:hypothetical protein
MPNRRSSSPQSPRSILVSAQIPLDLSRRIAIKRHRISFIGMRQKHWGGSRSTNLLPCRGNRKNPAILLYAAMTFRGPQRTPGLRNAYREPQ